MDKLRIIADVEGLGQIVEAETDFYNELIQLEANQARLISPRDEAFARLQTQERENVGKSNGTWTTAGFEYIKGKYPILRIKSRLNNLILAESAVKANKSGDYYHTENTKYYEESLKQAEEDENKDPMDRGVIVLPSRDNFTISDKENWEIYQFILKDQARPYFDSRGPIKVDIVDKDTADAQNGTLLTQLWFRSLDYWPGFLGDFRFLNFDYRARGVKYGAKGTQKISEGLPYTQKQVDEYLTLVQEVRAGILPASKLENIAEFLSGLKR